MTRLRSDARQGAGRNDAIFSAAGAEAFRTDAPDARIELLDGGHFLLEAHADEVAALMRDFLADALTTAQRRPGLIPSVPTAPS